MNALYERVPQCDFGHLPPARVCVDGDAYFYKSAYDFYVAQESHLGAHAAFMWSQLSPQESRVFYDLEDGDRTRAHVQRMRMLHAIIASPYHQTWVDKLDHNVVFGAAWNVGAFYVFLAEQQAMWVFGDEGGVVDILMSRQSAAGPMTEIVLRRAIQHHFLMGELLYGYSPCPPTVEPKASADASLR